MTETEKMLAARPKYVEMLGHEAALSILRLFAEIERGKYAKDEVHSFNVKGIAHPLRLRAIRADMQSFVNTFIDPYLEKKPYLSDARLVIDAGANIGYTAALFASWWPDAKIISIEPDRENFELAKQNVSTLKNVEVVHAGLWHREADLKIEAGQEDGFVVREVSDPAGIPARNLSKGISIDQLLKKHDTGRIDFLKMNIEGSEKEIFEMNPDGWLSRTGAMLIELHDGKNAGCSKAVFSAVCQNDFAVAETAPYGILFVREKTYRKWYAEWYRESIYKPNISKERFPEFYLDKEAK